MPRKFRVFCGLKRDFGVNEINSIDSENLLSERLKGSMILNGCGIGSSKCINYVSNPFLVVLCSIVIPSSEHTFWHDRVASECNTQRFWSWMGNRLLRISD